MAKRRLLAAILLTIAVAASWFSCRTTNPGSDVAASEVKTGAADDSTSVYGDIWQRVKAQPYAAGNLPHENVTLLSFGPVLITFVKDAIRTLTSQSDWLPTFRKLLRPNGMCLTGKWIMTEDNPYGGYFAAGSEALIIARASVNFDRTDAGQSRSFGMAGKLYPTKDPDDPAAYQTANFFLIDNNTGTKAASYLDVALLNEPKATPSLSGISQAPVLLASKEGQETAELKVTHSIGHSGIRQLYPIARLGTDQTDEAASRAAPAHLRVTGATTENFRTKAVDFRDELRPSTYDVASGLSFSVAVDGMQTDATDTEGFTTIGRIDFSDGVASEGCDHNLHFAHPKWLAD